MKIETIKRQHDRAFLKLGNELAAPVHGRARFLMERLRSAGFPITGVLMGMGTYFLQGGEFEAIYSDGSRGPLPIKELPDWSMKIWEPANLTTRSERDLRELCDLLDYLTDAEYLPLLDSAEA